MKREYLMGIDGGGTKTQIAISDLNGNIVSEIRGSGTAIVGIPEKKIMLLLSDMVHAACRKAGIEISEVAHCGIGLSGIDFPEEHKAQLKHIAQAIGLPENMITLVNDAVAALWGAAPENSSVIIQHGTDFTAAWRSCYGNETLFDHLNTGNITDIRKELMSLIARMIDGRFPATPLKKIVLARFGITDEAVFPELIYKQKILRDVLVGTPLLIYAAWLDNDKAATLIIEKAVGDYADAACAMIAKTGNDNARVSMGGGIINNAPAKFMDILSEKIHSRYPAAKVGRPALSPVIGALVLAAYKTGFDVGSLWNKFKKRSEK